MPSGAIAQETISDSLAAGSAAKLNLNFNLNAVTMSAGITDNPQHILRQINEDVPLTTRGPQEAALYRKVASSVVLIATKDGMGSGSLLNNNLIITNEHVVSGKQNVAVVFKPHQQGREADETDAVQGSVILVDKARDLALVQVNIVPAHVKPLQLGKNSSISVGSDVHAIGHPLGSSWTYTKGIVSQIRDMPMRGNQVRIIQTQTPINPGNSGGPLLNDKGEIVGVNTFKAEGGEGLNFAVSVDEVRFFVDGKSSTATQPGAEQSGEGSLRDDVYVSYEGRNKNNDANVLHFSVKGTDQLFAVLYQPDNKRQPLEFLLDRNLDNEFDIVYYSRKQDPKYWDDSYWDDNFDSKFELRGLHKNGDMTPYKFVSHRGRLPY